MHATHSSPARCSYMQPMSQPCPILSACQTDGMPEADPQAWQDHHFVGPRYGVRFHLGHPPSHPAPEKLVPCSAKGKRPVPRPSPSKASSKHPRLEGIPLSPPHSPLHQPQPSTGIQEASSGTDTPVFVDIQDRHQSLRYSLAPPPLNDPLHTQELSVMDEALGSPRRH